jgi:hypothetical protein
MRPIIGSKIDKGECLKKIPNKSKIPSIIRVSAI